MKMKIQYKNDNNLSFNCCKLYDCGKQFEGRRKQHLSNYSRGSNECDDEEEGDLEKLDPEFHLSANLGCKLVALLAIRNHRIRIQTMQTT